MTLFLDTIVLHGSYCVCLLNMQGSLPPFMLTNTTQPPSHGKQNNQGLVMGTLPFWPPFTMDSQYHSGLHGLFTGS